MIPYLHPHQLEEQLRLPAGILFVNQELVFGGLVYRWHYAPILSLDKHRLDYDRNFHPLSPKTL